MAVSVISTVSTDHEDMIHDAQMDYYGKRLATCSSDRSVKVYEVIGSNQRLMANLRGHDGPVWQVAWAHPMFGNLLASCSYDRKVIIWKEQGNEWLKLYESIHHDSSVNSISWAPHEFGLMLACGASDGAVSVLSTTGDGNWSPQKIPNAHSIGCNAVSWAPGISPVNLIGGSTSSRDSTPVKRFVSGGCDNLVKIWAYSEQDARWVEEETLDAHSDWVRDVAWAPNVGIPVSTIASCSLDCKVIIWRKNEEEGSKWIPHILQKFSDVIWHVSWSITGNILAVSGADNKVSLWKEVDVDKWVMVSEVDRGHGKEIQQ
eukprot:Seg122.3 transcript_id=Seg122.3/GoldUCD/mRNA.D3Y31 product="Protein SEC13" protein_id=Seg122.3/GoldUCD/D3Y31